MYKRILTFFLTIFILVGALPVTAADTASVTLTTLTTFFNEAVTGNYTMPGSGNTVLPLEITAQGDVSVQIDSPSLPCDYILKVYTDDSLIHMVQSTLLSTTETSHTVHLTAGSQQTLYFLFCPATTVASAADFPITVTASLKAASEQNVSTNKTLQNKRWTKKRIVKAKSRHYYKLQITGNRYFYLSSNNTYIQVQLLDKKKKTALSPVISLKSANNFQASFALGKGTYYVAVTADYQTTYQLYYQNSKVKNESGSSFALAPKMSASKQYLGLLKATTPVSTGQYYRFRLKRSQKLQIAFYAENSSGQFVLQLYDSKKQPLPTTNYRIGNASLLYINSRAAIPAGTYYFRVSKANASSSGCYSLMVRTQ